MGGLLSGVTGGVIGGAVVRLYLDSKQYQEGLAQAQAKGETATTGIGGAFSKLKVLGTAAFVALAAAAVQYAAEAIAAAEEHQVAVSQLTNAVGENAAALRQQASALQMVTGFSDEAIMQADVILSRYKLTADQLKQLNPLVLDYARATGQDVPTAAGNIGKALLGNTRALKTLGISYKATGNTATDFQTILADLQAKVGGVAVAFGQTSQGQAAILDRKFQEIKETVGMGLIPVIEQLKNLAISLGPAFQVVAKIAEYVFGAIAVAIGLVEDALAHLAQLADHLLGPLYDANVSTHHFSQAVDMANKAVSDAAVGVSAFSGSVANASDTIKGGAKQASEFRSTIKQSFGTLDGFSAKWQFTGRTALKTMVEMEHKAQQFAKDMAKLANSPDWIPQPFVRWLSQQGPDLIHGFENETNAQKRQFITAWRGMQSYVDSMSASAKKAATMLTGIPSQKNIDIRVNYKYVGYDPTKPIPGHP